MSSEEIAIEVGDVNKSFMLPHEKHTSLKSLFLSGFRKRTYEKQHVLKDISFDIKKGEFFGIVGRNGSGKSTLLKLLAGVYSPDKGGININGKLTPFIELGVGFNPELTGRENVFLNGALLGFNRKEMEAMYDEIVQFAELEKFMDQKLKNYSSGMQVRLAFSIAIRAKSDILVLDEVLAVGDALFQKKCFDYFKQLKKFKQTVVFVSHDSNALLEYCDKGILLEDGKIVTEGSISSVVNDYLEIINEREEKASKEPAAQPAGTKNRWGSGDIEIIEAKVINPSNNNEQAVFTDKDTSIQIAMSFKAHKETASPVYGITISDASGQRIFASNTLWAKSNTEALGKNQEAKIIWEVPNIFNTGSFFIAPAAADRSGSIIYDWRDEYASFKVRKRVHSTALTNVEHSLKVEQ